MNFSKFKKITISLLLCFTTALGSQLLTANVMAAGNNSNSNERTCTFRRTYRKNDKGYKESFKKIDDDLYEDTKNPTIVYFGRQKDNYLECEPGAVITFRYSEPGKEDKYEKIFYYNNGGTPFKKTFTRSNAKLNDSDGVTEYGNEFDLQRVLDNCINEVEGSKLTINFYYMPENNPNKNCDYQYKIYGTFRVYSNTSLCAPDKNIIIKKEKRKNENKLPYTFINTDDNASKKLTQKFGGSGNITLNNIKFNLSNGYSEIGKFIQASNINILNCEFFNGIYNCHVFELACVKDSKVENCIFRDLLYNDDKKIQRNLTPSEFKAGIESDKEDEKISPNYEAVQIECSYLKNFPYGFFSEKYSIDKSNLSENVVVKGCVFKNVIRGIGNHSGEAGKNITVTDNAFIDYYDKAVNINGYSDFNFNNNFFLIKDEDLKKAGTSHQHNEVSNIEIQNYVDVTSLTKISAKQYQLWFKKYGEATSYDLYYYDIDGKAHPYTRSDVLWIKNSNDTYRCVFTPVEGATKYRLFANKNVTKLLDKGVFVPDSNKCEREDASVSEIPFAPTNAVANRTKTSVTIKWDKDKCKTCDFNKYGNDYYLIERTDSKKTTVKKWVSANKTSYTDNDAKFGETYTYEVTRVHKCTYKNYYSVTKKCVFNANRTYNNLSLK